MLFLKDTVNPRTSDGNISDEEDTLQECPDTYEDHDNVIDYIDKDDSNILNILNSSKIVTENNIVSMSETETETSQGAGCIPTFESCGTPSISMSTTNLSRNSNHTLPRKKKQKNEKQTNHLRPS